MGNLEIAAGPAYHPTHSASPPSCTTPVHL